MGVKSIYTKELGDKICEQIAQGKSLRSICAVKAMPDVSTVIRWVVDTDLEKADFRTQYAQARRAQAELLADEIFSISDDGTKDTIATPKGKREDKEWTSRSRLKVDTRKWYLSKVLPKIYGDKLTLAGDAENPIATTSAFDTSKLSIEELEVYLELVRKMKATGDAPDNK